MIIFTPNTVIRSTEVNSNFDEVTATITKRHQLLIKADGIGGAVDGVQLGSPEVNFTGTPINYGRASGIIPLDYAGGEVVVKVYLWSTNTNNQTLTYYLAGLGEADTPGWNIRSNQTTAAVGLTANIVKLFTVYTIPANTVLAGDYIALAIRPSSAVTGTFVLSSALIEYTGNYK